MFERFTTSARAVVETALRQSEQLKSRAVGVEHLYLGVVINADAKLRQVFTDFGITIDDVRQQLEVQSKQTPLGDADAEALKSIGIDLDAIRSSLDASFGEGVLDQEPPRAKSWFAWTRSRVTEDGKKVLELSLREAIRLKSKEIRVEHILLGILRAPNPQAQGMIERHVKIDALRERVEALITRAA